jgi:hypothetical protein
VIQQVGSSYYDFDQLGAEFMLAGVQFTSLGTDGTIIFTYDASGNQTSLDPTADPIIAAHIPAHLQRDLVTLLAQPTVGLSIMDLTAMPPVLLFDATTLGLLFVALAYRVGALDPTTMTVLPIETWISR